jgi:ubiquinone/menaquinone biosynthesis C-methylase UbiE
VLRRNNASNPNYWSSYEHTFSLVALVDEKWSKRQGLAEIARVLKPGGRLLILDFQPQKTRERQSWIERHLRQQGSHDFLARLLHAGKEMGFIQSLPIVMKEVGFLQIETSGTKFRSLGFVLGRINEGVA